MQQQLHELGTDQLSDTIEGIARQITVLEAQLEFEAKELVDSFKESRASIQAKLAKATTEAEHKAQFAPLVLSSRLHKGTLEINWSLMKGKTKPADGGKRKGVYKYLKKGKRFAYPLTDLTSLSKEYELGLVVEAERKAAKLREMWSKVVALRVDLRTVSRMCGEGSPAVVAPAVRAELAGNVAAPATVENRRLAESEAEVLSHEFVKTHLGAPGA